MDWKTPPPKVFTATFDSPACQSLLPRNSFPLSSAGFEEATHSHARECYIYLSSVSIKSVPKTLVLATPAEGSMKRLNVALSPGIS